MISAAAAMLFGWVYSSLCNWRWAPQFFLSVACVGSVLAQLNVVPFAETCGFISRSPDGLVYLGTLEDVYVYDGLAIRPGSMIRRGSHNIQSPFFFDGRGNVWFSCYDGLVRYDRNTRTSQKFQCRIQAGGFHNSDYYAFDFDSIRREVLLKQGTDVYRFSERDSSFKLLVRGIPGRRMCRNDYGNQYFCYYYTDEPGILDLDSASVNIPKFRPVTGWPGGKMAQEMLSLAPDRLLIAGEGGLFLAEISNLALKPMLWRGQPVGDVLCVVMPMQDYLLVSTRDRGVLEVALDPGGSIAAIRPFGPLGELPAPEQMFVDAGGTVFLSSYGHYIAHFLPGKQKFRVLRFGQFTAGSGRFAQDRLVLNALSGKQFALEIPGDAFRELAPGEEVALPPERSFGKNKLLIEALPKKYLQTFVSPENEKYRHPPQVFRLHAGDGDWMLSSTDGRLFRWNAGTWEEQDCPSAGGKLINFCAHVPGVLSLSAVNLEMLRFHDPEDPQKIISKIPFSGDIYRAAFDNRRQLIYLATTQGLLQLQLPQWRDSLISPRPVVGENACRCVVLDRQGTLWLTTRHRLLRYHPEKAKFEVYSEADGTGPGSFLEGGCGLLKGDSLYFVKDQCLVVVDPNRIRLQSVPVPVILSNMSIHYGQNIADDSLAGMTSLFLSYRRNAVGFDVQAVDYSDPASARVRYRLEGHNERWIVSDQPRTHVQYALLSPGRYRFVAEAISTDGTVGSGRRILHLEVERPYWMRWWFRMAVAAAILGMGLVVFRAYYLRQIERRDLVLREQKLLLDRQQAIEKERSRIAAEMHDDLGSGLTTIRYLSSRALRAASTEEERLQIGRIAEQSNDLVRSMSEIIWALNVRNDSLYNLLAYLRRYAFEYLEDRGLQIEWNQAASLQDAPLSGEKRRNVHLIAKEALHNIVRHSGASRVLVHAKEENGGFVSISICDNGHGFDPASIRDGANGLENMQRRAARISGKLDVATSPEGTCLHLHFMADGSTH
ncbi:MAG: hypothetical protein JPMHGGIA_00936 [Saprospiraceae bacterium]|nr:hypothetical protein [Saprospiraceae bacterium]